MTARPLSNIGAASFNGPYLGCAHETCSIPLTVKILSLQPSYYGTQSICTLLGVKILHLPSRFFKNIWRELDIV
jgi:hypothetical protein